MPKDPSAKCYQQIETLQEKSRKRYQGLSKEEKKKYREYGQERYKNLSEHEKERLAEYRKKNINSE